MTKYTAFIFGRLTGKTPAEVERNVEWAARVAALVASKGYAAYCPHLLYPPMNAISPMPEDHWIDSCLAFLPLSNIGVGIPCWQESPGACNEANELKLNGIPTYSPASNDIDEALAELDRIVPNADEIILDTTTVAIQLHLARRRYGMKFYPEPVRPNNGRNSLKDVAEEDLDKMIYFVNYMREHCPEAVAELLNGS